MPADTGPQRHTPDTIVPINRLPPELLTDIFRLTIYNIKRAAFGPATPFALTLCAVCSGWRELILSNSLFWSSIPVGIRKRSHHLTQLCLERSKNSPIDVVAFAPSRIENEDYRSPQELAVHAHRVRSLDVMAYFNRQAVLLVVHMFGDQVPESLTHFSVRIHNRYHGLTTPTTLVSRRSFLETALTKIYDQIHTLHLSLSFEDLSTFKWVQWEGFKFSELKELVLDHTFVNYRGVSYIVATASNLQLLEFYDPIGQIFDGTKATLEPILRKGQGFKILRLRSLTYSALRKAMTLVPPGSWETELIVGTRLDSGDIIPILGLRNSSIVTALSLDNSKGCGSGPSIHNILETFPNLRALTLERFDLIPSVLSGIARPSDLTWNGFPRLSVLRLHSSRLVDFKAFVATITSHQLRRLEIWRSKLHWDMGPGKYIDESSPWLREYVPEVYVVGPE